MRQCHNIISSHFSLNLSNFKAEGRANETFDALLTRYHGSTHARRGRVVALKLEVSAPFRFVTDDLSVLAGGRGDRGLIVALKLVVSAPFRFAGFVATPKVTTPWVLAGCPGAKTSHFGTILTS